MFAHEKSRDGLTVFLHLYTSQNCIRKKFIFYPGEKQKIEIEKESLGTAFSIAFALEREGESWLLDGAVVPEEGCFWITTKADEEVLLVLSGRNEVLSPCGRVPLYSRQEIRIGNAFQNEVFYQCFSYVRDRHICLVREEENYVLKCPYSSEKEKICAYINGKAAEEKQILQKGDRIELMGLSMMFFPNLLVCSAFYGTLRTAERREEMIKLLNRAVPITEDVFQGKTSLSDGDNSQGDLLKEEVLHTGELELYLPEPEKVMSEQPLFLTAGPAMTMVFPMALTAVLGSRLYGGAGYYQISLVMTVASAFLSLFWGAVNHWYRKNVSCKEEKKRKEDYRAYLKETEGYLEECVRDNSKIMLEKYPSCHIFLTEGEQGDICRNKSPRQQDYLFVRLGLGDIPFQVQIRLSGGIRQNRDVLAKEAHMLAERYGKLARVPVGIDLREISCVGFAGPNYAENLLPVLIQLSACHDSRELKVACFYHQERENERYLAECIKWMPHVWLKGGRIRLLAGNEQEAGEILSDLVKELQQEETENRKKCFYMVVAANEQLIKSETLYSLLMDEKAAGQTCTVFLQRNKEQLPGDCQYVVTENQRQMEILCCQKEPEERQSLLPDRCTFAQTERYMRRVSGFRRQDEAEYEMPQHVSFLDLYDCHSVEELNCRSRWGQNQTGERMKVPVGMGAGGRLVYLDIHEKFHGPHGLVAGTTGAGKSELLQTYLLSLAVSFSPEDINFFIIDYKGGGMGNTLCQLPHCAGVISNLSGRQIKRALSSIKSENTRRQLLFSEAGVNHVEEYARLYKEEKVAEPIPHLLLVIDEFAELRREEPDFMKEIISVSQVGRSLGVHLILATQKPAGIVDDKIWSNTRFRLCLRVADRQDSLDMLHRPEAAYLTGAGRGYLQVGNNELYQLFQAGYSGAPCIEEEKQEKKIALVSLTGKRFEGNKKRNGEQPTQLQAVSGYINSCAEELGYARAKELWMQELPETLSLKDAMAGGENFTWEKEDIHICLGRCDDPERQSQYPLHYAPLEEGHLCLCGAPATGKSTFLQTLLWQLCQNYEASQVQLVLAASDNAGVNCFEKMPHCLGNLKNTRDCDCFFHHMGQLLQRRKELLQGVGFRQYRKYKEDAGAYVFFVVDNYSSFRQMTEDKYEDFMEKLAAEGISYGIYLVITSMGVSPGEIPARLFEKIKVTMSLEMSDKFQYGDILRQYQLPVLPRENVKGRGLARSEDKILEIQVPLIGEQGDDYERIRQIELLAEKLKENMHRACPKFPMIPEKNIYRMMTESFFTNHPMDKTIPLGYALNCGEVKALQVNPGFTFLISGAEGTGKRNLLKCLVEGLEQRNMQPFVWEEEKFVKWYWASGKERCLCIPNLLEFSRALEKKEEEIISVKEHMERLAAEHRMIPVIVLYQPGSDAHLMGSFLYDLLRKNEWGIHLGGNPGNQRMLAFDDLSFTQMNQRENPGIGYLKTGPGSRTERIFIPLYEQQEQTEKQGRNEGKYDFSRYSGSGSGTEL